MLRRAFTLIELLVIIVIVATMVTVSVLSVRSGQLAARTKGAARDIFAAIRHARSTALLTQQPAIITYSNERVDDEVCAKITVTGTKLMRESVVQQAITLSGKKVAIGGEESGEGDEAGAMTSVGDILFSPVSEEVVKGMRLKVLKEGEELEVSAGEGAKNKISVFSNVDYLLGRYTEKSQAEEPEKPEADQTGKAKADDDEMEPTSIVWEVNGRTEPHKVYVYQDGSKPEKGLVIKIDRFGGAKVASGSEDD